MTPTEIHAGIDVRLETGTQVPGTLFPRYQILCLNLAQRDPGPDEATARCLDALFGLGHALAVALLDLAPLSVALGRFLFGLPFVPDKLHLVPALPQLLAVASDAFLGLCATLAISVPGLGPVAGGLLVVVAEHGRLEIGQRGSLPLFVLCVLGRHARLCKTLFDSHGGVVGTEDLGCEPIVHLGKVRVHVPAGHIGE